MPGKDILYYTDAPGSIMVHFMVETIFPSEFETLLFITASSWSLKKMLSPRRRRRSRKMCRRQQIYFLRSGTPCSSTMEDLSSLEELEIFLDAIEDPNSDILQLLENSSINNDKKSEQYLENEVRVKNLPEEEPVSASATAVHDGEKWCQFRGCLDLKGFPTGDGALIYPEDKSVFTGVFMGSARDRRGTLTRPATGAAGGDGYKIHGVWKAGLLHGRFRKETEDGWEEGECKLGIRHGFFRQFGPSCWNGQNALKFFGRYEYGTLTGFCWKGMLGGGYLVGKLDSEGTLTGDDIVYMYPDFRSAIRGRFEDGRLVAGRFCTVVASRIEKGGFVVVPVCSEPAVDSPVFTFDPSTATRISTTPLVRDPWEDTMVEVGVSNLSGGEGLFAKDDLPDGVIICLFQGVRLRADQHRRQRLPRSDYRIRLNGDVDLDIPDDMTSTAKYRATLGHKANHSFEPNAAWSIFEHPRFGLIRSLASLRDIVRGEEIMVNYNIPLYDAPDWYLALWKQHVKVAKKWSERDVERFLDRQYQMTGRKVVMPMEEVVTVPSPVGATMLELEEEEEENFQVCQFGE